MCVITYDHHVIINIQLFFMSYWRDFWQTPLWGPDKLLWQYWSVNKTWRLKGFKPFPNLCPIQVWPPLGSVSQMTTFHWKWLISESEYVSTFLKIYHDYNDFAQYFCDKSDTLCNAGCTRFPATSGVTIYIGAWVKQPWLHQNVRHFVAFSYDNIKDKDLELV